MISGKVEDLVKGEVKRTFNPEFLNRLDEIILFTALGEQDLIQILELMVTQLNQNLAQKSITVTSPMRPRSGFWTRRWATAVTVRVPCGGLCRSTSKTRSQKR